MKNLFLTIILICLINCKPDDDLHRNIKFNNNANFKVWVAKGVYYSDTITDIPGYFEVMPNSSRNISEPSGYESLVEIVPNKEVLIIVKKDDPFVVVRRYILSLDTLNTLNWTITYP